MIGLDTNVLVRALTGDDPDQSPLARNLMRDLSSEDPGFISVPALCETWWVLRRDARYEYTRDQVLRVVTGLLANTAVVVESTDAVREAVDVAARMGREP